MSVSVYEFVAGVEGMLDDSEGGEDGADSELYEHSICLDVQFLQIGRVSSHCQSLSVNMQDV